MNSVIIRMRLVRGNMIFSLLLCYIFLYNQYLRRVLFQRALRVNKTSKKLWSKYFELELWYGARNTERKYHLGLETDEKEVKL